MNKKITDIPKKEFLFIRSFANPPRYVLIALRTVYYLFMGLVPTFGR